MTGKQLYTIFSSLEENQKMLLRFTKEVNKENKQFEENMLTLVYFMDIEDGKVRIWTNEKPFKEHNRLLESKRWIELLDPTPQPYSEKFLRLNYKIIYQETRKKVKNFEPIII